MRLQYLCPSEFYLFLYCYLALVGYYTQLYMFVLLSGFSIAASEYVTDSELPGYVRYVYRYIYLYICYKIFQIITLCLSLDEYKLVLCATLVLLMLLDRHMLEAFLLWLLLFFSPLFRETKPLGWGLLIPPLVNLVTSTLDISFSYGELAKETVLGDTKTPICLIYWFRNFGVY